MMRLFIIVCVRCVVTAYSALSCDTYIPPQSSIVPLYVSLYPIIVSLSPAIS